MQDEDHCDDDDDGDGDGDGDDDDGYEYLDGDFNSSVCDSCGEIFVLLTFVMVCHHCILRADFGLVPSQWETSLQSNAFSHWLDANLESALYTGCWWCHGNHGEWSIQDGWEWMDPGTCYVTLTIFHHDSIQGEFHPAVSPFLVIISLQCFAHVHNFVVITFKMDENLTNISSISFNCDEKSFVTWVSDW